MLHLVLWVSRALHDSLLHTFAAMYAESSSHLEPMMLKFTGRQILTSQLEAERHAPLLPKLLPKDPPKVDPPPPMRTGGT